MRDIGRGRSGYAIGARTKRASLPTVATHVSAADKRHALVIAEVEMLRVRVRALSAANTTLRGRVRDLLASQHAIRAAPDVAARLLRS